MGHQLLHLEDACNKLLHRHFDWLPETLHVHVLVQVSCYAAGQTGCMVGDLHVLLLDQNVDMRRFLLVNMQLEQDGHKIFKGHG
jgi:hypothetical protein